MEPLGARPREMDVSKRSRGARRVSVTLTLLFLGLLLTLVAISEYATPHGPHVVWGTGLVALAAYGVVTGRLAFVHGRREREMLDFAPRLLDGMAAGLVVADSNHNVAYANESFVALVGRARERLVGSPFRALVHPEDISRFDREVRLRRAGQAGAYPIRLRTADGRTVNVVISATPFRDHGRFDGAVALIADISATVDARGEADRARNVAGVLFDTLTHDLSNSLQGVVGRVQLAAATSPSSNTQARAALESAVKTAGGMARLVREVKQLASAERSSWPKGPTSVGRLVARGVDQAELTPLTFTDAEVPAGVSGALLFANALAPLAVAKLIEEAASSAPPGADPRPVVVRAAFGELGPSSVVIRVTGYVGKASLDELNAILAPPSRHWHGELQWRPGIRLVLARAIADAHGWNLSATAAPDPGAAVFEIRIPTPALALTVPAASTPSWAAPQA